MAALRKLRVIEGGAANRTLPPTPVAGARLAPPVERRDRFAFRVALALLAHAVVIAALLPAERFGGPKATGTVEAIEIDSITADPGEAPASRGTSLPRSGKLVKADVVRPEAETKPAVAVGSTEIRKPDTPHSQPIEADVTEKPIGEMRRAVPADTAAGLREALPDRALAAVDALSKAEAAIGVTAKAVGPEPPPAPTPVVATAERVPPVPVTDVPPTLTAQTEGGAAPTDEHVAPLAAAVAPVEPLAARLIPLERTAAASEPVAPAATETVRPAGPIPAETGVPAAAPVPPDAPTMPAGQDISAEKIEIGDAGAEAVLPETRVEAVEPSAAATAERVPPVPPTEVRPAHEAQPEGRAEPATEHVAPVVAADAPVAPAATKVGLPDGPILAESGAPAAAAIRPDAPTKPAGQDISVGEIDRGDASAEPVPPQARRAVAEQSAAAAIPPVSVEPRAGGRLEPADPVAAEAPVTAEPPLAIEPVRIENPPATEPVMATANPAAAAEKAAPAKKAAREAAAKPAAPSAPAGGSGRASRGTAGGAGRAGSATALAAYYANLSARIAAVKSFPPGATRGGTTVVRFTVDTGGHVLAASVAASSGNAVLDHEALAMVHRASFPPIPTDIGKTSLSVRAPVTFRSP